MAEHAQHGGDRMDAAVASSHTDTWFMSPGVCSSGTKAGCCLWARRPQGCGLAPRHGVEEEHCSRLHTFAEHM